MLRTRRGGAARRPNGRIKPSSSPPLFLRKKKAQKTYGLAATAEVRLQAMREQPPLGPAQRLPAGSGKQSRPGREGESLPLSSPSRPGFVYYCEFINLLKSEGGHPLKEQGGLPILLLWPEGKGRPRLKRKKIN